MAGHRDFAFSLHEFWSFRWKMDLVSSVFNSRRKKISMSGRNRFSFHLTILLTRFQRTVLELLNRIQCPKYVVGLAQLVLASARSQQWKLHPSK